MAPIAVKAPTGVKSTTAPYSDKSMKRGRSVRRSSTQRRPQQLSPHFAQAMQGQQDEDEDEDEDATISHHPRLQTYRRRERQSYINPRQHMLHLPDSARPATSRSHMRDWDHHRDRSRSPSFSKKLPPSDSLSQQPHVESRFSLGTSSMGMTSEEFEALPPTIQRKVSRFPSPSTLTIYLLLLFSLPHPPQSNGSPLSFYFLNISFTWSAIVFALHLA